MASSNTLGQDHVYVSLLKSIKTLDVDWKKFASETGIKAAGNAQRKLKENLKKDGLTLVGGKIVPFGTEDDVEKNKVDVKETKTEAKKTKAPAKRKKTDDDGDEEYEAASSTKKTKKAKYQATVENADEDA